MGIFDDRMNKEGAIVGMVVGLSFTFIMILLMRSDKILGTAAPMLKDFLGFNAEGIGMIGMILNFVAAFIVSRMTPPPPQEITDLLHDIRVPKGAGDAHAH